MEHPSGSNSTSLSPTASGSGMPLNLTASVRCTSLNLTAFGGCAPRNRKTSQPSLSLTTCNGCASIIKFLLDRGADINAPLVSKSNISPLMLASLNGHVDAVNVLLKMGCNVNAKTSTKRNTALSMACSRGKSEVVSMLLDWEACPDHRNKSGMTPLMEAANNGHVNVAKLLLDKGVDVNATTAPASRDTALTIAACNGHAEFVELLLARGASVAVKNKRGNSPIWLASGGGHQTVLELLEQANADIHSQNHRKVSCLMVAFYRGHIDVVRWIASRVTQFPIDRELVRYLAAVNDEDLRKKCQECLEIIRASKETRAHQVNQNAAVLLHELDKERSREDSKKSAGAKRRERKQKKKHEIMEKLNLRGDEECGGGEVFPVAKKGGDSGFDDIRQGNQVKSKEEPKDKQSPAYLQQKGKVTIYSKGSSSSQGNAVVFEASGQPRLGGKQESKNNSPSVPEGNANSSCVRVKQPRETDERRQLVERKSSVERTTSKKSRTKKKSSQKRRFKN